MKQLVLLPLLGGLLLATAATAQPSVPTAPSGPASDTYFGVKVDDPYRNLENLQDPAVAAWMKAQSEYARRTLDAIPGRQGLIDQMVEIDKRKAARVTDLRVADNDRYFYYKSRPRTSSPSSTAATGTRAKKCCSSTPKPTKKARCTTSTALRPAPTVPRFRLG